MRDPRTPALLARLLAEYTFWRESQPGWDGPVGVNSADQITQRTPRAGFESRPTLSNSEPADSHSCHTRYGVRLTSVPHQTLWWAQIHGEDYWTALATLASRFDSATEANLAAIAGVDPALSWVVQPLPIEREP